MKSGRNKIHGVKLFVAHGKTGRIACLIALGSDLQSSHRRGVCDEVDDDFVIDEKVGHASSR